MITPAYPQGTSRSAAGRFHRELVTLCWMRRTAAILCVAALALAGCSETSPADIAEPSPPPPLQPVPSAPAASTAPATQSPQQAVQVWQATHSEVFSNLMGSMNGLAEAMKTKQLPPIQEACGALDKDVDPLTSALPSPDPGVTGALQTMADDVKQAAQLCGGFTSATASTADAQRFTSLMADAQQQFDTARKMMNGTRG